MDSDPAKKGITGGGGAAGETDKDVGATAGDTHESDDAHKSTWTFLTNHAHVLLSIAHDPDARVRDIAQQVGITERGVQRILAELEEEGYISRVHHGRRNSYELHDELPLRHPTERHQQVSALLGLVMDESEVDSDTED